MAHDEAKKIDTLTLDEFPPHTYEAWRKAAEQLLKGAPFEKLLISKTYEGFNLDPIYRKEDIADLPHLSSQPGLGNQHRGGHAAGYHAERWKVAQETKWTDPSTFNKHVLRETQLGLTEVNIPCEGPGALALNTLEDIDTAFDRLDWRNLSFNLQTTTRALPLAGTLVAYLKREKLPLSEARGCIDNDPLGYLARQGSLPFSLETAYEMMAEVTTFAENNCPHMRTIGASGLPYANGGASSSQELGYALATAVEYLREMDSRGISPLSASKRLRMTLSVGPNFFLEIAKIRAARCLWAQVMKQFGDHNAHCKLYVHCRTGLTNKTLYDAHTNMLRTSTEALAAILGNCDSLDIAPFDELNPQGGNLPRRAARNIHTILGEECDLRRVVDAGGGSYYLEWLTDQVARKAWETFQSIEKEGGMSQALKNGIPQTHCRDTAIEKQQSVSRRKEKLVGTNMYPNARENILKSLNAKEASGKESPQEEALPPEIESILKVDKSRFEAAVEAAGQGATVSQITAALHTPAEDSVEIEAIPVRRLAEDYESLRLAAEAVEEKTGQKPTLLQLNLGPSRRYRLRADWTSSFFQVGGFQVDNERDFADSAAIIETVKTEKPTIGILTSDDQTYQAEVPSLAKALKEANPDMLLLLAGHPGDQEAAWKEAGVDDFVHVRVTNFDMLKALQTHLGIQS